RRGARCRCPSSRRRPRQDRRSPQDGTPARQGGAPVRARRAGGLPGDRRAVARRRRSARLICGRFSPYGSGGGKAAMRDFGSFDYVIVGGGSAGCVLANRLSASGVHRVLLLEAGGEDRHFWIHIPLGYGKLFSNAKLNWLYETEPEPELNNRRIVQPRGKVLGGSSSINGCIYIRGQKEDFDHWRQLGNVGWGWDDVLPYFKKAEDNERGPDDFHGQGGPLAVSDQRDPHELCEAFIAAAEQTGIPRNRDFNGALQEGAGYFQTTTRNGRRCSAAVGYLRPARKRPNLRVVTEAPALRVMFDGRQATGVAFEH